MTEKPLTRKELAAAFGCSTWFVSIAKRHGFAMPGRRATLGEFRSWLAAHPLFRTGPKRRANKCQQKPTEANT